VEINALVDADAELNHVPTQDRPTSKSAPIQHRQRFVRSQTGSVTSRQLGVFDIGINTKVDATLLKNAQRTEMITFGYLVTNWFSL